MFFQNNSRSNPSNRFRPQIDFLEDRLALSSGGFMDAPLPDDISDGPQPLAGTNGTAKQIEWSDTIGIHIESEGRSYIYLTDTGEMFDSDGNLVGKHTDGEGGQNPPAEDPPGGGGGGGIIKKIADLFRKKD